MRGGSFFYVRARLGLHRPGDAGPGCRGLARGATAGRKARWGSARSTRSVEPAGAVLPQAKWPARAGQAPSPWRCTKQKSQSFWTGFFVWRTLPRLPPRRYFLIMEVLFFLPMMYGVHHIERIAELCRFVGFFE